MVVISIDPGRPVKCRKSPGRQCWVSVLVGAWLVRVWPAVPPEAEDGTEAAVWTQMRQVLARDAIRPIYAPRFVTVGAARYRDDELVLGISIGGQSRAYDISTLNAREMVVDQLAGTRDSASDS